jgi:type VI secretion system protein ImpA
MDTADLLKPIHEAAPCGEDLSFSAEFDQIAESRREDDPTLSQGEWVTSLKTADWPGVASSCQNLLRERTKDLRLAMWLTEAWAMTRGHEGLHEGLSLCLALSQQHWADLHPQPDEGDQGQRTGNIAWLLQRLVWLSPTRPIARSRQGSVSFSLQDWRQGNEPCQRALRETPPDALRQTLAHAQGSLNTLLQWQSFIDTQMGMDGPSFVSAREALSATADDLSRLARDLGVQTSPTEAAPRHETRHDSEPVAVNRAGATLTVPTPLAASAVTSRAQAVQQLRLVAAYFKEHEPHSPVAYLADKAVAWADMPLHEWLRQVIKDPGAMAHLQELLGTAPATGEGH